MLCFLFSSHQVTALQQLKSANPDGRFWIKVDGTDVRPALLESMRKEWNGDVDLGNGNLLILRRQYDERCQTFKDSTHACSLVALQQCVTAIIDTIDDDITFLSEGLEKATKLFREKDEKNNNFRRNIKMS